MSCPLQPRNMRSSIVWKLTLMFLCIFVERAFSDWDNFEGGKEVYVANTGHDYIGCGPKDTPCKTIRYAVNQTEPYSKVLINGSSGPFSSEAGDSYIVVRHSLWLSAWTAQKVTIQCTNNRSMLFHVTSENLENRHTITCLTLSNVVVQGCHSSGLRATGVISLENAQLKLNNSEFIQNGLLIHHPQTSVNETCRTAEVYIKECSLKNNFATRPFMYGISLLGCENITLIAEDSSFHSSPIAVKSRNVTNVRFIRVGFDGSGIKGSSVQVTASPGDNGISFNRCNITRHLASKSSPVTIFLESVPIGVSTATFTESRFFGNRRQSTSGGALSIVSRFRKTAQVDVRLDRCVFEDNSAMDVGGAVRIAYVKLVHISGCMFRNNTGTNGGAISLMETQNVTVANTIFENNSAFTEVDSKTMANGGAIYAEKSDLQVTYSNFTGNTAVYSGSTLFATRCSSVLLTSSQFESAENASKVSPQNQMVFISTADSSSENATVWMVKNVLLVHGRHDQNVMFVKGKIHERNNSLTCPEGHSSDYSVLLPDYTPKYFDYMQLGAWCEACPNGKYGVSVTENLTSDGAEKKKNICRSCPFNAVCEYGQIRAMPNYWGLKDNDSVEMFLCPRGHCCDSLDSCTGYQSCMENRNGTLCSECDSSSEKSIHLGYAKCTPSQRCWKFGVTAGFVASFFLLFFLILAFKYNLVKLRRPANGNETETLLPENAIVEDHQDGPDALTACNSESVDIQTMLDNLNHLPAYCISVVVFFQLASIVYPRFATSGEIIDAVVRVIMEIFNFLPPLSVADICTSRHFSASFSSTRFLLVRIFFWGLLVLGWIIFAVAFIVVRCFYRSEWQQKVDRIRSQFDAYLIFLFLYSYVPLMRFGFEGVTCIHVHNKTFVVGDSTSHCYQTGQILIILCLICCIVPLFLFVEKGARLLHRSAISWNTFVLCCVLPILGMIKMALELVFSKRHSSDSDVYSLSDLDPSQSCSKSGVFHAVTIGPYRNTAYANGLTIVLFRSFVLVALGTLLTPWPLIQSIVLILCCALFLSHHLRMRWFVSDRINRFEILHLVLLVIFAAMNVYSAVLYVLSRNEREGITGIVQSICDWFCRVVLLLYLFYWITTILFTAAKFFLKQRCKSRRNSNAE